MSKLLKFIVNLFLIAAILIAVAILVPPLAGVTTTIVDTSSMNTNLPLGSITYSTDIDVFDIKAGDVILKENDSSTYAYTIEETDAENGRFVGVSTADPEGAKEDIVLRNTVSKVAVSIPYIGYILIAMHSLEGIIIVVLIVVLMIILFILSELWKVRPEEEEEAPEEEPEEEPQVTAKEETGIDTDAIRAAVEENHTALGEDASIVEQASQDAEQTAASAAAGAASAEAMSDNPFPMSEAEEDLAIEQALAGLSGEGQKEAREITLPDTTELPEVPVPFADSFEEVPYSSDIPAAAASVTQELPEESGSLAKLAEEMEERAKAAGTDGGYSFSGDKEEPTAFADDFSDSSFAEDFPEASFAEEPLQADAAAAPAADAEGTRFVPTARPAFDEIVAEAKDAGKDPYIKKDDRSGISIVDVSDML